MKTAIARDNLAIHGAAFAAKQLRKQKVPFAIAYWLIFGLPPRQLNNPPPVYCQLFAKVTGRELQTQ